MPPPTILSSLSSKFACPATARIVPVASKIAVITNANTIGKTTGLKAPMISSWPMSECSEVKSGKANKPWYFTLGSNIKPNTDNAIITNRIPPGTPRRSKPIVAAKPITVAITGKLLISPNFTGKPALLATINCTLLVAIKSKNKPIPMPVPWAMPLGKLASTH